MLRVRRRGREGRGREGGRKAKGVEEKRRRVRQMERRETKQKLACKRIIDNRKWLLIKIDDDNASTKVGHNLQKKRTWRVKRERKLSKTGQNRELLQSIIRRRHSN